VESLGLVPTNASSCGPLRLVRVTPATTKGSEVNNVQKILTNAGHVPPFEARGGQVRRYLKR
jgi:hypothetical protein